MMNRFSPYLRDLISWYSWKIKIEECNQEYQVIYIYHGGRGEIYCDRYYYYKKYDWKRPVYNYRRYEQTVNRIFSYRNNRCTSTAWLPQRYKYSSGRWDQSAYKCTQGQIDFGYSVK